MRVNLSHYDVSTWLYYVPRMEPSKLSNVDVNMSRAFVSM